MLYLCKGKSEREQYEKEVQPYFNIYLMDENVWLSKNIRIEMLVILYGEATREIYSAQHQLAILIAKESSR